MPFSRDFDGRTAAQSHHDNKIRSSLIRTKARKLALIGILPRLIEGWGRGEALICTAMEAWRGCSASSYKVNSSWWYIALVLIQSSSKKSSTRPEHISMPYLWSSPQCKYDLIENSSPLRKGFFVEKRGGGFIAKQAKNACPGKTQNHSLQRL